MPSVYNAGNLYLRKNGVAEFRCGIKHCIVRKRTFFAVAFHYLCKKQTAANDGEFRESTYSG